MVAHSTFCFCYGSQNKLRLFPHTALNEMGGACDVWGEGRGIYRVLMGKPEGTRPLGTPTRRWEDNIKRDLQEVGCRDMDWIELAPDRERWRALVNAVMNPRVP